MMGVRLKLSWYKMHRGWMDNPILEDRFSRHAAWVWLIENARWTDNGTIRRGQLTTTTRQLATRFGWGQASVSRFLSVLEAERWITRKVERKRTVITIENYDDFQGSEEQPGSEMERSVDRKWNTIKEGKKDSRREEYKNYTTYSDDDWKRECFTLALNLGLSASVVGSMLKVMDATETMTVIEHTKGIPSTRRAAYCMGAVKRAKGQPKEKASDKWERNIINSGWERNF